MLSVSELALSVLATPSMDELILMGLAEVVVRVMVMEAFCCIFCCLVARCCSCALVVNPVLSALEFAFRHGTRDLVCGFCFVFSYCTFP